MNKSNASRDNGGLRPRQSNLNSFEVARSTTHIVAPKHTHQSSAEL